MSGPQGYDVSTVPDGPHSPNPSITNIIGMMNEDFLPTYYAKLVAEYAISHMDALKFASERFGEQVAIGTLKAVPSQPHPNAAIGDEVHNAIDALIKNEPPTPLTTVTAVRMFAQFVNFLEVRRPRILYSEYTVWSYKHGFAGTGDLMWEDDEGVWFVDTKTGNNIYPKVALQTSAAVNADVLINADGSESPIPRGTVQGVLHVRPMSVKLHKLQHTDEAWEAFLACKVLFDWRRFCKETTVAEPVKFERPKVAK